MERGYPDIDEAVNEVFEESIHGHMELDAGVLALALEEVAHTSDWQLVSQALKNAFDLVEGETYDRLTLFNGLYDAAMSALQQTIGGNGRISVWSEDEGDGETTYREYDTTQNNSHTPTMPGLDTFLRKVLRRVVNYQWMRQCKDMDVEAHWHGFKSFYNPTQFQRGRRTASETGARRRRRLVRGLRESS
ncbi:hypothetical protein M8818_004891 [Zalaria obscura]|uniref:Uncharacterized protein n=1 Tax=Zalaria obscura TaxID=2024903 RepID=A0ACC3SC39_9PEZI